MRVRTPNHGRFLLHLAPLCGAIFLPKARGHKPGIGRSRPGDFLFLDELRKDGITDYVAFIPVQRRRDPRRDGIDAATGRLYWAGVWRARIDPRTTQPGYGNSDVRAV